ncbi:hypothetical protein EDD18DRAFT_1426262 [Armillaria luteobubalina]|uniref:Heterokaryon incompatibility domain-containing protein n=1 Tax=Armillaria luteobubalina TaxID=153913 RepID=A0AA39TFE6_9AGAR|nr:hypothetical protein EDD18DRAFT_1426262 [Armillaria luteobubalina]
MFAYSSTAQLSTPLITMDFQELTRDMYSDEESDGLSEQASDYEDEESDGLLKQGSYYEDEDSDGLSEQVSDYEDEEDSSSGYSTDQENTTLPLVTLTSLTETGQDEPTIPVLKQRSYTGRKAIPSALADTLCADLGINGALKELNTALGTSYKLDFVISILNPYIAQNVDFGTAYAYLCWNWCHIHLPVPKLSISEENNEEMRRNVLVGEVEDRKMRLNVLADGRITTRHVHPRRVWDLHANRVVPYWVVGGEPWAISHAWVDEKERVDVMTPINGGEWPVPMPKDVNLDLIHIEMLNMRSWWFLQAEYEGGKNEHLRLDEWKLDVPTIRAVYERAYTRVVYYLNGLGRPLHLTPGYFESDRCWFRHAWMLQEMTMSPIIAGVTGNVVVDTQVQRRFDEELKSLQRMPESTSILHSVSDMQDRVSTKPLDKVAGLVYPLYPDVIPIYDANQSPAEAWEVLMDVMGSKYQAQLLFLYPEPGDGKKRWRPSWQQVTSNRIVVRQFYSGYEIKRSYCIKSANVHGLSEVPNEPMPRKGEVDINDDNGAPHTLKIIADHMHPIPDGVYTLLGCDGGHSDPDRFVVGQIRQDGKFEKLSVFCSADDAVHLYSLKLDRDVEIFLC